VLDAVRVDDGVPAVGIQVDDGVPALGIHVHKARLPFVGKTQ